MKKLFILAFIAVAAFVNRQEVIAQATVAKTGALQLFSRIRQSYANSVPLQFRVRYVYANETRPQKVLDSANGFVELGTKGYYCKMDSTETIQMDSVTVLLFNEDKIMYLSKNNAGPGMIKANPVALLDSFFIKTPGLQLSVESVGTSSNISLSFPPGMVYKQVRFVVDTTNYFITSAIYTVKTEKMMEEPGSGFDKTQYDEFALIKADFFNYKKQSSEDGRFSESHYFIIGKDGIITTNQYKEYQIFAASPNL